MSVENVGSVEYDSRITTDKLKRDAAEVDRIAKKAGDDLGDHSDRGTGRASEAFQKFGKIAAVALVATGAAVAAFGVSSAKAFIESENAIAQTEAVLKSTGQTAGVTSKMVTDLANSFQRQTRYSDETIRSAENMLLTFTNISSKTFPGATEAVLDMATAMGTDLQSTAIQVGKALQDPVLGATALQRVGVRLTESQKDLIKSLVASGDAAGAQAVILKELQTEFGGSAKAAGQTFAGRLDILKNQLGEVQEAVGELIIRGLGPLVSKFLGAYDAAGGVEGIMIKLGNAVKPVAEDIRSVASSIGNYLGPKLSSLFSTIREDVIPALTNFVKAFGPAVGVGLVWVLGTAVDALKIFLAVISPVISFLADHEYIVWGVVGAFAALKAILIIDAVVTAFTAGLAAVRGALMLTSATAAATTGGLVGLRTALMLLVGPWQIALAIAGVAAVIASLELIESTIKKVSQGFDDLKAKQVSVGGKNVSAGSDLGIAAQLRNAFQFRAAGGPVSAGQPYIVGENNPELFVPRTSGTILPEVPGSGSGSVTVNLNMAGIMARSTSDLRDIGKDILRAINQELTAKGQSAIGGIR